MEAGVKRPGDRYTARENSYTHNTLPPQNKVLTLGKGPLARVGLARAYVFQGDITKAGAGVPGFSHPLERRRSRHPHPAARQDRIRQPEVSTSGSTMGRSAALISRSFDNRCTLCRANCARCYSNKDMPGKRGPRKETFDNRVVSEITPTADQWRVQVRRPAKIGGPAWLRDLTMPRVFVTKSLLKPSGPDRPLAGLSSWPFCYQSLGSVPEWIYLGSLICFPCPPGRKDCWMALCPSYRSSGTRS